jgi:hypothetical protein
MLLIDNNEVIMKWEEMLIHMSMAFEMAASRTVSLLMGTVPLGFEHKIKI